MSIPNNGNDPPAADQSIPEQRSPNQLQAIIDLLTTIQQSANDDRTTMRQFMDTVTRRLANPLEIIESLCINLRNPSDELTTQRRGFNVDVNPHVNEENNPEQVWEWRLNDMTPERRCRFLAFIGSRINADNGATSRTTEARGTSGSSQINDQSHAGDSINAELQRLGQSDLEKDKGIKELEETQKSSQANQNLTTVPDNQMPARGPHGAQMDNDPRVESSSAAQRRAQQGDVSQKSSDIREGDAEMARNLQQEEYEKAFANGNFTRAAPGDTTASRDRPHGLTNDEDGLSTQEGSDEAAEGKRKRDKDKKRLNDATDDETFHNSHAASRTPLATDSSSGDNAALADAQPPDTVDAQLRITANTPADGTTGFPSSMVQPQAQTQPVQNQRLLAPTPLDAPSDGKDGQAAAIQPRRNHTRDTREKPATENASTSTTQKPTKANKPRVRPGYVWEDGFEKRALPPSPPKIKSSRSTKPKANRPVKSSAQENSKEAEDDGIDEIPADPKKRKADEITKNKQNSKTATGSEAADGIDGDEVALGADDDNSNEAPAQRAKPDKKRKSLLPDPMGDVEGRSHPTPKFLEQ
jgi:hypothetical protein